MTQQTVNQLKEDQLQCATKYDAEQYLGKVSRLLHLSRAMIVELCDENELPSLEFAETFMPILLDFLWNKVTKSWLSLFTEHEKQIYFNIFFCPPKSYTENSDIVACVAFQARKYLALMLTGSKTNKNAKLLEDLLVENLTKWNLVDFNVIMVESFSESKTQREFITFSDILCSLPSRVANVRMAEANEFFIASYLFMLINA